MLKTHNFPINKRDFTDVARLDQEDGRGDCQAAWHPWAASFAKGMTLLDVGSGVSHPQDMIPMGVALVTTQDPCAWCKADITCDVSEIGDKWDVVTCFDVIEHVVDYGRFARHLARLASKRVIITTPGVQVTGNAHHYHYHEFLANEVVQLFEAAGMTLEAVKLGTSNGEFNATGNGARRLCADEPVVSPMGFVFKHD